MPVVDYALLWAVVILAAALMDQAWVRWLRPVFERRFGWTPMSESARIPAVAWAGGGTAVIIMLVILPWVGVAAGY